MKSFLTFTIEAYTPPAGQQSFPPFSDFVGPTKKPGVPQSFNPANVGPQIDPYPGQAPYGRDIPKDVILDRIKQHNSNLPPDKQYSDGIDDTKFRHPKGSNKVTQVPDPELFPEKQIINPARDTTKVGDVASDVAKVTQKAEPGILSRLGTIAKTVAKNPLVRAGGKALGVAGAVLAPYGVYSDAQQIATDLTKDEFTGPGGKRVDHSKMTPAQLAAHNMRNFTANPGTKF